MQMIRRIGTPSGDRRYSVAAALLGFVTALVLAACGGSGGTTTTSESTALEPATEEPAESEPAEAEAGGIVPAPAFTTAELEETPGDNWITNGGDLTNGRFSSLDEIDTENVKELKGEWLTKIGQNATSAKFSAEGQALEYEGTIYIPDGPTTSTRSTRAPARSSGPTNPTSRPTHSAKWSAAAGTTAGSPSAKGWSSSRS
jgi:glucose dehydrogenase